MPPFDSCSRATDDSTLWKLGPPVNSELSAIAPMITRMIQTTGRRKKRVRSMLLSGAWRPDPPDRRPDRPIAVATQSWHRSFDGTPYRRGGGFRQLAPEGRNPPPGRRPPDPLHPTTNRTR